MKRLFDCKARRVEALRELHDWYSTKAKLCERLIDEEFCSPEQNQEGELLPLTDLLTRTEVEDLSL